MPALLATLTLLLSACRSSLHSFPLRVLRGRLLLAPVEVSGAKGWFLLDTGSSDTIVSPSLGSRLRPADGPHPVSSSGLEGNIEPGRVRSDGILFAGARLRYPEEVSVIDVGFLAEWAGTKVDGIVAYDVLREYVWGVDLRGRRLAAGREPSPAAVLAALGVARADATLPLEIVGGVPTIGASAGRGTLRLVLDTGAERTMLSQNAFRRLGLELAPDSAVVKTRGVNGDNEGHMTRLAELRAGSATWRDVDVVVLEGASPADADGLLGMDLLSDDVMVVDGRAQKCYLARSGSQKNRNGGEERRDTAPERP